MGSPKFGLDSKGVVFTQNCGIGKADYIQIYNIFNKCKAPMSVRNVIDIKIYSSLITMIANKTRLNKTKQVEDDDLLLVTTLSQILTRTIHQKN